jgi:hypothetical protein
MDATGAAFLRLRCLLFLARLGLPFLNPNVTTATSELRNPIVAAWIVWVSVH